MAAKFDASALAPESANDDAFKSESAKSNPAIEWLRQSYELDTARQVKVPATQVRAGHTMLDNAARELSGGCAVRLQWDGKTHTVNKDTWEAVKGLGGKHVTVIFKGKDRVARPRKAKTTE